VPQGERSWDFFIVYAKKDPDAVRASRFLFEKLGATSKVFLDTECLLPGDHWPVALKAAQERSAVSLVLISADADEAFYKEDEIARGIDLARRPDGAHRVVPLFLNGVRDAVPPYGLHGLHAIELRQWQELLQLVGRAGRPQGAHELSPETIHLAERLDQLNKAVSERLITREDAEEAKKRVFDRWMEAPPNIR
jgi:hypothetical protein